MSYQLDPSVLREYDIRGIYGETLSAEDAYYIGLGFGTVVKQNGGNKVGAGRDGRISSPILHENLIKGLVETGIEVINVGMVPTPGLYFSVFHLDLDGGIEITGSHNPKDHNGFKIMLGKSSFFGEKIKELGALIANGQYIKQEGGKVTEVSIIDAYVDKMLEGYTSDRALKICWDTGNGAAGEVVEKLTSKLPGEHIIINQEVDGNFPNHHPDPTVEKNLAQLKECVSQNNCDLGLAFDGDADRIGAIDSQGRVFWGDQILALLSREICAKYENPTIVADVKCSQMFFDEVRKFGGNPIVWKTGHSLIKTKMIEESSPLSGEMSGHIFYKDKWFGFDDGIYSGLRLANVIAESGKSANEIYDELPKVFATPEIKVPIDEKVKFSTIEEIRDNYQNDNAEKSTIDGIRVSDNEGWWLIRASNTTACLTVRVEGKSEELKDKKLTEVQSLLAQYNLKTA